MEQQAVVVGGGQAAAQAFVGLRVEGDSGRIVRVGTEAVLPYLRPPLSKADLAGQVACARRLLRPPALHEQQRVAMHPDVSVTGVRMAERKAESSDGRVPDFDRLVFATVGRPRRLKCPDGEHSGLYRFRDMAGVQTIHPQLKAGARRGLIGGGYIGLEIPAVASKMGLKVAALEATPPLLARVTCVDVATFYRCKHERHGGDIRCNATGSGIDGSDEKPQLMTQDGGVVEAALVIPGIGLLPNIELAEQSGLSCDNGIMVDDRCRTSVDGIDAAGDGTQHPSAVYDAMLRLESAPNAIALSRASRSRRRSAARPNPIGRRPGSGRSSATQAAGRRTQPLPRSRGAARSTAIVLVRHILSAGGALLAVDAINRPVEFTLSRTWIADASIPPKRLPAEVITPPS